MAFTSSEGTQRQDCPAGWNKEANRERFQINPIPANVARIQGSQVLALGVGSVAGVPLTDRHRLIADFSFGFLHEVHVHDGLTLWQGLPKQAFSIIKGIQQDLCVLVSNEAVLGQ